MTTTVEVPVLYLRNPDEGTWTYVLEHPSIMGGPFASREEAEAAASEALCRTLHRPIDVHRPGPDVGTLRITVNAVRETTHAAAA